MVRKYRYAYLFHLLLIISIYCHISNLLSYYFFHSYVVSRLFSIYFLFIKGISYNFVNHDYVKQNTFNLNVLLQIYNLIHANKCFFFDNFFFFLPLNRKILICELAAIILPFIFNFPLTYFFDHSRLRFTFHPIYRM